MDDVSSSLLCHESESCLIEGDEGDEEEEDLGFAEAEAEEEYVRVLVSKEADFGTKCNSFESSGNGDWLKYDRLEAVRWILKIRLIFGFTTLTAYLSVAYLDRFLSIRSIDKEKRWAIRLLSVACLSLAAKMEECNVPALSEYKLEDYPFECKVIQRMELLVLSTLDWRLSVVTPFAYLRYFATKFSIESKPEVIISRAVELLLAAVEEMNSIEYRPSAIAAASIFVALDERLTKRTMVTKIETMLLCGVLDNDHTYACYSLMRDLKLKLPTLVTSADWSYKYSSPVVDALDDASLTLVASKRRRLSFDDDKPIH